MKTCVIFCAAGFDSLAEPIGREDFVIAADGGFVHAEKLGLTPDGILGDFDSLGYVPECGCEIIKHPVQKNDTDTMLAVKTGFDKGFDEFVLYGCAGKRLDHTFANIQTLSFIVNRGGRGVLQGEDFALSLIKNDKLKFDKKCKGTISVFSVTEKSQGVNINGLLYDLENAELTFDFPLGVSNEFVGEEAQISVNDGIVAVIWSGNIVDLH